MLFPIVTDQGFGNDFFRDLDAFIAEGSEFVGIAFKVSALALGQQFTVFYPSFY